MIEDKSEIRILKYETNTNIEIRNSKQIQMTKIQNAKQYDLEERTFQFSKSVALYVKQLPRSISNLEYSRQVVDSSGSVGANYIEANEGLSKKDFVHRIRISRKEAKETKYWLLLIPEICSEIQNSVDPLLIEAKELILIFSKIINSCTEGKITNN